MFFTQWAAARFGQTLTAQYLGLALTLLVLFPIAKYSYAWFEAPYFTRWRKAVPS